jgi:hypothetical protein
MVALLGGGSSFFPFSLLSIFSGLPLQRATEGSD